MGDQGAVLRLARRRVPTFGAAVVRSGDADADAADHHVLEGERVLAAASAQEYPYPKGIEDYTAGIAAFEDAYPKLFPFVRELLAEEEDLGHSRGFETLRQFPTHNAIFALAVGCTVAGFDIIANELLVRLVRHHGARALYAGVDKTVQHHLTATGSLDDTVAFEAASALINVGAPPDGNPEVTEYPTPLHIAARKGKLLMVRLLLEAKASLDIARPLEGSDGGGTYAFSALGMAAMAGQTGAVRLLLSAGADPNFKACYRPLHLAVISDFPEIVHDLAAHGAKLDVTATRLGETALHFAASKGHFECASALVFLGADARLKYSSTRTASQMARAHGHYELAAWLKASEAGRKGKGGKGGKGGKAAATSLPATSKALTAATVWGGTAAAAELAEIEKRRLQRLRDEEDAKAEAAEVEAKAAAAAAAVEEEEEEMARVDRVLQVAEASHPDDKRSKPVLTAVATLAAAKSAAFTQCELELSLSLQRQPRDGAEAAGMKSALRAAGEKATLVAFPGMEDYASISISIEPESGMTLFFNVRLECPPSKYESEELDGFRSDVAR